MIPFGAAVTSITAYRGFRKELHPRLLILSTSGDPDCGFREELHGLFAFTLSPKGANFK
jgi:hypothetical protein